MATMLGILRGPWPFAGFGPPPWLRAIATVGLTGALLLSRSQ